MPRYHRATHSGIQSSLDPHRHIPLALYMPANSQKASGDGGHIDKSTTPAIIIIATLSSDLPASEQEGQNEGGLASPKSRYPPTGGPTFHTYLSRLLPSREDISSCGQTWPAALPAYRCVVEPSHSGNFPHTQLCSYSAPRSCTVIVEVAVLGSPSLISLMVSLDVKQHRNKQEAIIISGAV